MAKGKTSMTEFVLLHKYRALFMYFPKTQLLLKHSNKYSQSNKNYIHFLCLC